MGVNSLPKTVTRQRLGWDLNPGPSAPESSSLTTRLASHPQVENRNNDGQFSTSQLRCVRLSWAQFERCERNPPLSCSDAIFQSLQLQFVTCMLRARRVTASEPRNINDTATALVITPAAWPPVCFYESPWCEANANRIGLLLDWRISFVLLCEFSVRCVMHPWFDFWFRRYIVCLFISYVSPLIFFFIFPYLSPPSLIFSFENTCSVSRPDVVIGD